MKKKTLYHNDGISITETHIEKGASVPTHAPTPWAQMKPQAPTTIQQGIYPHRPIGRTIEIEDAAFIVRAVNAHDELLAIVKAIAESFNAGANKVYAEALAPHTDDETLMSWINKVIAKVEGKTI